jgi:hypothetical protein
VRCGAARRRPGGEPRDGGIAGHTIAGTPHDELRAVALSAVIRRPLREVGDLLPWLLARADGARRIAILEALADAPDDVAAVVAPYLADVSGEVRRPLRSRSPAPCGPARSASGSPPRWRWSASAVRFALYDALANQVSFDLERIALRRGRAVSGAAARRRRGGRRRGVRRPAAAGSFERAIVPMLTAIALAAERSDNILAAVAILAATCTGRCRDALRVIATCPEAPAIARARSFRKHRGVRPPSHNARETPRE